MGGNLTIVVPPDSEQLDSVSDGVRVFEAVANLVVSVTGVIGNVLTLLAVCLCRRLHAVPNVYVANLAVADLLITAVVCPLSAYASFADTQRIHCEFFGAVTLLLLVLSVYTLGAIAVNRYILICRPRELYLRVYGRPRNVALTVAAVWLLSLAIVSPPMFGFGTFDYHVKLRGCFFTAYDFNSYLYGSTFLSFGTLLPTFTFTLFAYARIVRRFRHTQRLFLRTSSRYPASPLTSSLSSGDAGGGAGVGSGKFGSVLKSKLSFGGGIGGGSRRCGGSFSPASCRTEDSLRCTADAGGVTDSDTSAGGSGTPPVVATVPAAAAAAAAPTWHPQQHSVSFGRDLKVTLNLLVVFIVFIACWLPVASVFVADYRGQLPATVYSILMILAYSNSALNVFLYAGMNPTYRRAYKCILLCRWGALSSAV